MINNSTQAYPQPYPQTKRGAAGSLQDERYVVPQTRPDHVLRPRLIELIEAGVQRPLTVVSAPAGAGKTALVASWAATCQWPLLWMTLDESDAEPLVFWERLSAGLEDIGVDLAELGSSGRPVVVALDAGATASNATRDRALGDLLLGTKGVLRLILIARADPVFPMEWYRLAGELTEVRAADLAVNESEAQALVRQAGMVVTAQQAAALCARTSGWMIALKFAIMSLAGCEDISLAVQRFSETDFDIVSFLFNEVIDALPLEIRDLLLRTSVVDLLTPELVELLAGRPRGGDALEFLANGNQFIERSSIGSQRCYRYQPLFRKFLQAQLAFEKPELDAELRRTAQQYLSVDPVRRDSPSLPVPVQRSPEVSPVPPPPNQIAAQAGRVPQIAGFRTRRPERPVLMEAAPVVEPLTPREQEVLEHLAELLSTVEIAVSMFVSVNTVRTHIRSILRKLGVSRRHEAVRRAWQLGLLPSPADALAQ